MNKIALSGIVAAAGLSASALAQTAQYTFQMQLVPDTTSGTNLYPIGTPSNVTATRVAFWLQARVSSTGENWGIARASAPGAPDCSYISVADSTASTQLGRGVTSGSNHGRGTGFRSGGADIGVNGNTAGNAAYPGVNLNNNGGMDSGNARIYGFDAYVGATRNATLDENGDGTINPWGINGAQGPAAGSAPGSSSPSVATGVFSPWANLYRVWVDISNFNVDRDVVLSAHVLLNAGAHTADVGGGLYPMQLSAGQVMDMSYTFHVVPTPGAAAVLGLGGLLAGRRRR